MAATVEQSLQLDVGTVTEHPEGAEAGISELRWRWPTQTVRCVYLPDDDVVYLFATEDSSPDSDMASWTASRIGLEYTPANLGGERPWFSCPECGTRRAKLYKPPQRRAFLCRDCHDLLYDSQTATPAIRQPFETMEKAKRQLERDGLSEEALRTFHDGVSAAVEDMADRHEEREDGEREFSGPLPFDEWVGEFLADAFGAPRPRHGYCEATASTTGERCRQPATGEHGKCYYHGGAEGSGAPEGNQNAVTHGAYSKRFPETLTDGERDAMAEAIAQLDDGDGAQDLARLVAAMCLLQYRRSDDPRFLARFESLCETFALLPDEREDARCAVEEIFRERLAD